ncbi:hypothetical protein KC19_1G087400 [Ceratodon purpureus]|uniref:D-alanyl-D-alanine carboxypeptidase-like core domain-containing protein n=1 Tax=Ceratodon purpureus TaxID=3225 RepID=A0A8T0J557_CERPU|nr:hypothetical protein KC19_1G087400 [Ceratodon purpureus]
MQDAAREEGVWLIPLCGFCSVNSQQGVFFDLKAERKQSVTERAKISAPPGYSMHHTGYAIDIGDPTDPKTYFRSGFILNCHFQKTTYKAFCTSHGIGGLLGMTTAYLPSMRNTNLLLPCLTASPS